jgi:membrane associated rhomboid family serine protease
MAWKDVVSRGGQLVKRVQFNSPVVLGFSLLCLGVFGLGTLTGGATNRWLFSVYPTSWADPLGYLRLFGHALGHVSLAHYVGNIMLILLLGPGLEEKYGSRRLMIMIAVTAVVGGLVFVLVGHATVMGASGLVFMMILLSSFVNFRAGRIPLTLILVIILYLGQEVFAGAADAIGLANSGVSHLGHIVGGVCGAVFGYLLQRDRQSRAT